ncbi:SurA N-terminal domain-containing protein [Candidatus Bipolaricaulota bacterium]|nr:SurA N-terminal domain-containing protein [Candidatus Bipolaricaulota bacterium]
MRRLWLVPIAVVLGLSALGQEPVALVNGQEISRQELEQATGLTSLIYTIYQQFPRFAQTLLTTEEGSALIRRYQRDVLEQLILRELEVQEAEARGLEPDAATLEDKVQETMDQILMQNDLTEEELSDILAQQGRTLEGFREEVTVQVREQLMIQALQEAVTAPASVSEEEIEAYYQEHPDRFTDEAGEIRPLAEVHDDIEALLLDQKRGELWRSWLEETRAAADVQIMLEGGS